MRKKIAYLITGLALTLWVAGCGDKGQKAEESKPATQTTATAPAAQATTPAAEEAPVVMVTGTVKEVITGGGFTYVKLDEKGTETWYAMPESKIKEGETITIQAGNTFPNFYSKALNRTFDKLIFSPGMPGAEGANPHAMPHGDAAAASNPHAGAGAPAGDFAKAVAQEAATSGPMANPDLISPGSAKAVVPFAALKVQKATGANAYTVGDVFAKAAALNNKKIRVRGQVVKVSTKIMGKNWVHIQDGTGNPNNNTHDLVVTTMSEPAKGDTVTVDGTMSADKDFGAGYRYSAIIEDATVTK